MYLFMLNLPSSTIDCRLTSDNDLVRDDAIMFNLFVLVYRRQGMGRDPLLIVVYIPYTWALSDNRKGKNPQHRQGDGTDCWPKTIVLKAAHLFVLTRNPQRRSEWASNCLST